LARQYPNENRGRRIRLTPLSDTLLPTKMRSLITSGGTVLMVISGLVLLIACGNLANLLLARATERSREITLRMALGASQWRLGRQLLTESLLLPFIGGIAGLGFAAWARNVVWAARPPMFRYAAFRLDLGGRVLLFNLAASILTAIFFGLAPAL